MTRAVPEKFKILLDELYFAPDGSPGSFSTVLPLYRRAKSLNKSITLKLVRDYLAGNASYLLHKRVRRKHARKSLLALYPHEEWSIDLIFYTSDRKSNDNKAYCLNCYDNFSHRAFGRVLKNKTAKETLSKFQEILIEAKTVPKRIFSDFGSEFFAEFGAYCKEKGIKRIFSTTGLKAFPVESFNASLRLILERIFTFQRNRKWTTILQQAFKIYNSTKQPSLLNWSPIEASTSPDAIAQLQAYYFRRRANRAEKFKNEKPAFYEGQIVKIVKKDPFRQRVTKKRFSTENYKIRKVVRSSVPIVYKLADLNGTSLLRTFYKEELTAAQSQEELQKSLKSKRILAILSKKSFATKWLRSGKAIEFEERFLVKSTDKEDAFYLTETELHDYDNGKEILKQFLERKNNG